MKEYLSKLRKDYGISGLHENDADPDPINQFEKWFTDAVNHGIIEPNAMMLATVTPDGKPTARIVLLRNFNRNGFVFYTNYKSNKGRDLLNNPFAALSFFWADLERQIRIEGHCEKISTLESIEYFNSRPRASQIGAWASEQSMVISGRDVLDARIGELEARFNNMDVEKPPHWGGFRVIPNTIEFWQGRPNRLHDRLRYSFIENNSWKLERLSP